MTIGLNKFIESQRQLDVTKLNLNNFLNTFENDSSQINQTAIQKEQIHHQLQKLFNQNNNSSADLYTLYTLDPSLSTKPVFAKVIENKYWEQILNTRSTTNEISFKDFESLSYRYSPEHYDKLLNLYQKLSQVLRAPNSSFVTFEDYTTYITAARQQVVSFLTHLKSPTNASFSPVQLTNHIHNISEIFMDNASLFEEFMNFLSTGNYYSGFFLKVITLKICFKFTPMLAAKTYLYLFGKQSPQNNIQDFFQKIQNRINNKILYRKFYNFPQKSFTFLREHKRTVTYGFLGSTFAFGSGFILNRDGSRTTTNQEVLNPFTIAFRESMAIVRANGSVIIDSITTTGSTFAAAAWQGITKPFWVIAEDILRNAHRIFTSLKKD